jgi:hypothetical protein
MCVIHGENGVKIRSERIIRQHVRMGKNMGEEGESNSTKITNESPRCILTTC